MNVHCLLGHKWEGCTCKVCGASRDQEHDWEIRHCRRHCRKCNLPGDFEHRWQGCRCQDCGVIREDHHDWQGCVCRICGQNQHQWLAGICSRCGEKCSHPESTYSAKLLETDHTAHSAKIKVCKRCGEVLR